MIRISTNGLFAVLLFGAALGAWINTGEVRYLTLTCAMLLTILDLVKRRREDG